MLIIPSWAIGVGFIVIVVATAQVVVRRLVGRTSRGGQNPAESEVASLTQALDHVQHRLAELEERVDFAERLLAKERAGERIAPPHG